jgi:hypothetical protein
MSMKSKFFYCDDEVRKIWNKYGVYFSVKFCLFFSNNFESYFFENTGIKPSSKVQLGGFKQNNSIPMYQVGQISKLNLVLWIMPEFMDDISFCWKSKTGNTIHTHDEDFDENDLQCWIENLNPGLYWKEVSSEKNNHPFIIKNLPYKLNVYGFGVHMVLQIFLSNENIANEIITKLSMVIEKHNIDSEFKNRKNGVVHNASAEVHNNIINLKIDVGSAGVIFIKKLLGILVKYPQVTEVSIDV